jgi:hypothetical protein
LGEEVRGKVHQNPTKARAEKFSLAEMRRKIRTNGLTRNLPGCGITGAGKLSEGHCAGDDWVSLSAEFPHKAMRLSLWFVLTP